MLVAEVILMCSMLCRPLMLLDGQEERTWGEFDEEANRSWKELREHSRQVSFETIEDWSIDGAEFVKSRSTSVGKDQQNVKYFACNSKKESLALMFDGTGLIANRPNSADKWHVKYRGSNDLVLEELKPQIRRIQCPPLTPVASTTFEEILAIEGVVIDRVDEVFRAMDRRIVVAVKFLIQPVTIDGMEQPLQQMRYEFDPAHHWVVTRHDITMKEFASSTIAQYTYDSDGWPIPTRVETTIKRGVSTEIQRLVYRNYKYGCDPTAFHPQTHSLPD